MPRVRFKIHPVVTVYRSAGVGEPWLAGDVREMDQPSAAALVARQPELFEIVGDAKAEPTVDRSIKSPKPKATTKKAAPKKAAPKKATTRRKAKTSGGK